MNYELFGLLRADALAMTRHNFMIKQAAIARRKKSAFRIELRIWIIFVAASDNIINTGH